MGGAGTLFLGQKYADDWAAVAPQPRHDPHGALFDAAALQVRMRVEDSVEHQAGSIPGVDRAHADLYARVAPGALVVVVLGRSPPGRRGNAGQNTLEINPTGGKKIEW